MSWSSCMQNKIINHYGSEVKQCADAIEKGNIEDVVKCMVNVLGITDPEIWIPEQVALLGKWAIECEF